MLRRSAGVAVEGEPQLVDRLGPALQDVLAARHRLYLVRLHHVGRRGEVLVSVDGSAGHAPVILQPEQQAPGVAAAAVRRFVERLSL